MLPIKMRYKTCAGLTPGHYKRSRLQKAAATSAGGVQPPLHELGRAGGLLGRGNRLRYAARTARGAQLALVRKLFLALDFFVETNGLVLDDRVLHAEAPLELVNQFAVIGSHLLIDVNAFTVLGDLVGELARAPVLCLFDLAALFGDGMLDGAENLFDFLFRRGRAGDENQIVQTFFHDDLFSSSSCRLPP